jgi:transposase
MDGLQRARNQCRKLEQALAQCHDKRFFRRLLALRQVDQGASISQVAVNLGVSRQSIHNWLRVYRTTGRLDSLEDRPHPGRPSLWDQWPGGGIAELLSQSPQDLGYFAGDWTVPLLAEHVRHTHGQEPSWSTLRRRLHALGYTWKRSRYVLEPDPELEKKTSYFAAIGPFAAAQRNLGGR